jgi:hypothetical protein
MGTEAFVIEKMASSRSHLPREGPLIGELQRLSPSLYHSHERRQAGEPFFHF